MSGIHCSTFRRWRMLCIATTRSMAFSEDTCCCGGYQRRGSSLIGRKSPRGTCASGRNFFAGSHGALVVQVHLKWNSAGALKKFFWRLADIRWIGMYGDGSSVAARVPPAVLAAGVPVDVIPKNAASMRELFSGAAPRKMESLAIAGEAAKDLASSARYEIWEITDLHAAAVPPINVTILPGLRSDCKIDVINSVGVLDRNDVVPVAATEGYVTIRGWAGAPHGEVVLMIDGKPYRAEYGFPRPDLVAIFRNPALSNSGFELTLPAGELRGNAHQVRAIVRSGPDGYQECVHTLRFEPD